MEYASFSFHLMAPSTKRSVNAIHYTALRAIYKKKKEFGNSNLLSLAQDITMDERLGNLKENYFKKAIKHKNPLIMQLIEEYKSFKNGRSISTPTVFCGSKVIDEFFMPIEMPLNSLFEWITKSKSSFLSSKNFLKKKPPSLKTKFFKPSKKIFEP